MAWKKNSLDAVRRFDVLAAGTGAQWKVMFGCPVYLLGGQRYALLHENRVILRLSPEHAVQLIAKGGRSFEPIKGRPRKDRVVVPEAIAESAQPVRSKYWSEESHPFMAPPDGNSVRAHPASRDIVRSGRDAPRQVTTMPSEIIKAEAAEHIRSMLASKTARRTE